MRASISPTLPGPDQHSISNGVETHPAVPSEESATSAPSLNANPAPSAPTGNARRCKRRRNLRVVTLHACNECRKKRAKCDGQKPCGRCNDRSVECIYIPYQHVSKAALRKELDSLREHQRSSDRLIAALVRPVLGDEVLSRLHDGQSVESIARRLDESAYSDFGTSSAFCQDVPQLSIYDSSQSWSSSASDSHSNLIRWRDDMRNQQLAGIGVRDAFVETNQAFDDTPRFSGFQRVLWPLSEPNIGSVHGTWTSVTSDTNLVHHLLALYFCWEYPIFAPLSKEHFLRDFHEGRHRYCSPILVNALLALGCRFSSEPVTRTDPDNHLTSGDHFFQEAQRFLYQETDHHSLTTIQALGIMSVRETSCGRHSVSLYYAGQSIRLALEMGLHRIRGDEEEDERVVVLATFWGAFALDNVWALAINSLPHLSGIPELPPKPPIIKDIEESLWAPYTDNGASLQHVCVQASNTLSVFTYFGELSELVHRTLYRLNPPGNSCTMKEIVSLYTSYLEWYDHIPDSLRLGHNSTPAVLFMHMYYQFAVLSLFQPYITIDIAQSRISPSVICSEAADAIQSLVKSFSILHSLRMAPSLMSHLLLASTSMVITVDAVPEGFGVQKPESAAAASPHISHAITRGMADLSELALTQQSAEQALGILRGLAEKWSMTSISTAHTIKWD